MKLAARQRRLRRTSRRCSRSTRRSGSGQLALGALTFLVLASALLPLPPRGALRRVGVVLFATVGEVTGSLLWGVYHYRLHNLPLFVPPAHGLVYLAGLSLATACRTRARRLGRRDRASGWGVAGPHRAAAGRRRGRGRGAAAARLPLAVARAGIYAAVFLVVAGSSCTGRRSGLALGDALPRLGIADGNPPSGVASGYVWFDVMALLVAPWLLSARGGTLNPKRWDSPPALSHLDPPQGADGTMSA